MRIQFTPQYYTRPYPKTKPQNNTQKNIPTNNIYNPIAYQDYNVSFGARTPENFYEFNADSMPYTMRNYLNYDYEQRQHMPPEQMMNEVFKHLDKAKNFEEVKKLYYPKEDLFKNLHPLNKNARKGILSEIKVARDLSDTPLLKDGSDDFGMYLLKKIYKEGKTLKEISKDFLEKDINEEYKGFITAPIDYATTAAYGIKFPDNGFWHSFISTREEYKKFFITLPKNTIDPNRLEAHTGTSSRRSASTESDSSNVQTRKKPERKYKIQKYKKDQLTKEIKNAKGDIEGVERAVRKRFSKDDPEASFIIKYLSPIMTVAADKVHLSEEMKYFYEFDDNNMKSGHARIERFWKSNPELLENYSTAITDTIELFEDVYGAGGMIPINNTFEPITSKTENQKAIDYVTPEFIELLDYTQGIKPARDERYAKHDVEQQEWEAHFKERYGEVNLEEAPTNETSTIEQKSDVDIVQDAMDKAAAANPGVKFYDLNLENGTKVSFAVNLEEEIKKRFEIEYCNLPKAYTNRFTKFFLNHPKVTDRLMLAITCKDGTMKDWGKFVSGTDYSDEEMENLNKQIQKAMNEQFASQEEVYDTLNEISAEFESKNPKFMKKVRHAVMEYSTRLDVPDNKYLQQLIVERYKQMEQSGEIAETYSDEERMSTYSGVLKQAIDGIKAMKSHNIVFLNTRALEGGLSFLRIGNTIEDYPAEMDDIMKKYNTPLSNSEKSKILKVFMNIMLNMDTEKTESFKDPQLKGFYKACMSVLKKKEYSKYKKELTDLISKEIIQSDNSTLRYLLDPNADANLCEAKVEFEIGMLMQKDISIFKRIASLDPEFMEKYIKYSNPDLYIQLKQLKNI